MSEATDNLTTILQLKRRCSAFCEARDWKQFHNPKDLALALSCEAAEILELFRFKEPAAIDVELQNTAAREALSEEMADVLYFLLMLSDHTGVDLSTALERKMDINEQRYPADRAFGRNVKYTQLQTEGPVPSENG